MNMRAIFIPALHSPKRRSRNGCSYEGCLDLNWCSGYCHSAAGGGGHGLEHVLWSHVLRHQAKTQLRHRRLAAAAAMQNLMRCDPRSPTIKLNEKFRRTKID